MKVSVIITTCNRDTNILKEAIDCVVNQTYQPIELIVVNDSPFSDNRSQIDDLISSYSYPIKYLVNSHTSGANYSRNKGFNLSSGELISFLDDDDTWSLNRIETIVGIMQNDIDLAYSDYYIVSQKNKRLSKRIFPNKDNQLAAILSGNFLGGFSNVTIKRQAFEEVGMLDNNMPSYQDQDLFIRLLKKCTIQYIPEPLMNYRLSNNSISLNGKKKLDGLIAIMQKYDDLYKQYPVSAKQRLESELVNALKCHWHSNARVIISYLKNYVSLFQIIKLCLIGEIKYIISKLLSKRGII